MKKSIFLLLLGSLLLLGCGQTGPLILPADDSADKVEIKPEKKADTGSAK